MSANGTGIKYLLKRAYLGSRGLCIRLLIRSRKPAMADLDSVRSILAIRIDRIGDVVVSLPAIKALHAIFPNAKISTLVRRSNAALLADVPYIAEVIPYAGFRCSVARIRRMKFDIAVDMLMDYSIKTAVISFLSGAPVRAGFDIASRGRFFNIAVTHDAKEKHMSEHILDMVRSVGLFFKAEGRADWDPRPRLTVSKDAIVRMEDMLRAGGISKEESIVSIHPGGHFSSQRWMPESFAKIADMIAERYDTRVVIIGGSTERKLAESITSLAKTKPVLMVGRPLDEVAAIISVSKLLICNNSGPLHMAAALGTPTVSIMGPTDPALWRPQGDDQIVIRKRLPCSPCPAGRCDAHVCMSSITVDEVFEKAKGILDPIDEIKRS